MNRAVPPYNIRYTRIRIYPDNIRIRSTLPYNPYIFAQNKTGDRIFAVYSIYVIIRHACIVMPYAVTTERMLRLNWVKRPVGCYGRTGRTHHRPGTWPTWSLTRIAMTSSYAVRHANSSFSTRIRRISGALMARSAKQWRKENSSRRVRECKLPRGNKLHQFSTRNEINWIGWV